MGTHALLASRVHLLTGTRLHIRLSWIDPGCDARRRPGDESQYQHPVGIPGASIAQGCRRAKNLPSPSISWYNCSSSPFSCIRCRQSNALRDNGPRACPMGGRSMDPEQELPSLPQRVRCTAPACADPPYPTPRPLPDLRRVVSRRSSPRRQPPEPAPVIRRTEAENVWRGAKKADPGRRVDSVRQEGFLRNHFG